MSNFPSIPTSRGEFQAHFGGAPGSSDAMAECKMWEKLCSDLLADREKMRKELTTLRCERDQFYKSVFHLTCKDYVPPPFTKEEVLAHVDEKPTFEELIAEVEREYAQEK